MNNGQQPQDSWPEDKPATTEDFAAYDALVEIAEQGEPRFQGTRPLGTTRRLVWRLGILALGCSLLAALLIVVLAGTRSGSSTDSPGTVAPTLSAPTTQPVPAAPTTQPTPAPTVEPSATAALPDTWRFTGKWGVDVTITLLPEGDGYARISVKGEPDAKGGYTWKGSTLKISYKQPVTLLTGNVVDTKGRFTCTGEPSSAKLRCTIRSLGWTSTTTSQNSQWLRFTATGRPNP